MMSLTLAGLECKRDGMLKIKDGRPGDSAVRLMSATRLATQEE